MSFVLRTGNMSLRAAPRTALRHTARHTLRSARPTARRGFSTSAPAEPKSSNGLLLGLLGAAALGSGYYYYKQNGSAAATAKVSNPTFEDYQNVYNAIAKKLIDEDDYDDGSYGPILVRLAWHSSGTYDKATRTGGSFGGTMRFEQEAKDPANNGLENAREFLEPFIKQFPFLSHGDLWTLGGVVAIQEMSGPKIKWRPGRVDLDETKTPPRGRLPDAAQGSKHIRDVFYRMGFNDEEIVALIGAHCLGRCHPQSSGYSGPWTFSPTTFTNDFFKLLLDEKWQWKKWDGPAQYEDVKTKSLMMLPADYALVQDKEFKKYVTKFAKDNDYFFKVFADAFSRLLELNVPFGPNVPQWEFKTLDEQES